MLTALIAISCLPQSEAVIAEFKKAFAARRSDYPTAKVDPGIDRAMDILIGVLRRSRREDQAEGDRLVEPFAKSIHNNDFFATNFRSVGACTARQGNRIAVSVSMGGVSRLRVFDTKTEKAVSMPAGFEWRLGHESQPTFLPAGKLMVNGSKIQDFGVRYGYVVWLLTPKPSGYGLAGQYEGAWALQEEGNAHLATEGSTITLSSIDDPKSFFTSSGMIALSTIRTIDFSGTSPRLVKSMKLEPVLRAVDDWMFEAMKNPRTADQRSFQKAYGKSPSMLDDWSVKGSGAERRVSLWVDGLKFECRVSVEKQPYRVISWSKV